MKRNIRLNYKRAFELIIICIVGTTIVVLGTWVYTQIFREYNTPANQLTPSKETRQ